MTGAVREYTPYFDFEIPQFDFPGWHVYYDRNIKTIDTILYLMTGTDSLKGIWKNNELYEVGDRVVDTVVAFAYECHEEHTSSPAPKTFAQERIDHPNYWHAIDFIQALAGSSDTTHTIALGNKTFATQTGRIFTVGAKVMASSATNPPTNFMWGGVVSYTGSQLVLNVEVIGGSGTYSDWLLSVSGVRGPQGEIGPIGIQGPQGAIGPVGPVGPTGPQGIIAEAPTDGGIYGRKGDTASWTVVAATSAGSLPNTPAGDISSTNVQAALNELDTEKLAKAGGVMTGPITLAGTAHWTFGGIGSGSWFSTSTLADRFFVGTTSASDDFRIYADGSGANAFTVSGATGKISVLHPPTSANHIATKAYVDGLVTGFVSDSGDIMTGTLTVPQVNVQGDIFHTMVGSQPNWITRGSENYDIYRWNAAYGLAMTLSRTTGDATFERDVIVTRNLRTSGSLAVGANVTTGFSGDGTSVLIRAYGAGAIFMQYANGAAHYARFGHNSSTIYGTLQVDSTINSSSKVTAAGNIEAGGELRCNGVLRMKDLAGSYLYWDGINYNFGNGHVYSNAGRLYGSNDFNPATFVTQNSGPTFSSIEGPYFIDMMHPGHTGDWNARLIVQPSHNLDILSNGVNMSNWLAVTTGISAGHFHSKSAVNVWHFNWENTLVAYIDGGSWGSVLNAHSDYRLKKGVTSLQGMWDIVKALRPVKYTSADWAPYSTSDEDERWGFLAHELQETMLPTASTGVKDGTGAPQQPHWPPLIAALCKALQEAMTRIEALEASLVTR